MARPSATAFRRLPVFPEGAGGASLPSRADDGCCRRWPKRDLDRFGAAITELQRVIGDYFAPVQGARFISPRVAEVLAWLEAEGRRRRRAELLGADRLRLLGSTAEAERLLAVLAGALARRDRASPSPSAAAAIAAARSSASPLTSLPLIYPKD